MKAYERKLQRVEQFYRAHFVTLEEVMHFVAVLLLAVHQHCDPATAAAIDEGVNAIMRKFLAGEPLPSAHSDTH